MKRFDVTGLRLSEYQGKLFEASVDEKYSSPIFLRRYYHSNLLKKLSKQNVATLSLDVREGLDDINQQFGESEYGKIKFSKDEMFWMGYLYQYIAYTRETDTRFLMNLFKPESLRSLFYAYHTQDNEWCVKSLLEEKKLSEQIFDKNWRLKREILNAKTEKRPTRLKKSVDKSKML